MSDEINKGGRPTKYDKKYHTAQVMKYALLGLTDVQMADLFDISESTLNNWKIEHPEFLESLKKGKDEADANVASMLYKKAVGFTQKKKIPIKLKETVNGEGSKEKVEIVEVEDYFPPDAASQFFWLKNRQSGKWRDSRITDVTSGGKPIAPPITMLSASELTEEQINTLLSGGNGNNANSGEISEGV